MHAIEIQRNGVTLAVIGAPNALMLAADVGIMVEGPDAGTLDLRGMNDLGGDRKSHTNWVDESALSSGDVLLFRFIEAESATPPLREVAEDSEESVAERQWYEEQTQSLPMAPRELERRLPNATLELSCPGREPITATLEGGREFISLHLLWNQWRRERCRLSLSSFSQQEALSRAGSKEWFQGYLLLGEQCVVKIGS